MKWWYYIALAAIARGAGMVSELLGWVVLGCALAVIAGYWGRRLYLKSRERRQTEVNADAGNH